MHNMDLYFCYFHYYQFIDAIIIIIVVIFIILLNKNSMFQVLPWQGRKPSLGNELDNQMVDIDKGSIPLGFLVGPVDSYFDGWVDHIAWFERTLLKTWDTMQRYYERDWYSKSIKYLLPIIHSRRFINGNFSTHSKVQQYCCHLFSPTMEQKMIPME